MTILATIIVLGVLIFVHELGHFMAAKAVGVEVQRFSIGLGPRVTGFKVGETDYVVSAVPLGGYVKMGGMGDEVLEAIEGGSDGEPREPGPRDFDAKPIWARTLVITAGVLMNFFFAFVAYTVSVGFWGSPQFSTTRVGDVRGDLLPPGAEALERIERGQRISRIGDRPTEDWGDVREALLEAPPGALSIELAEQPGAIEVRLPREDEARSRTVAALSPWRDAVVGLINPGSPADEAGLEVGDRILAVDGISVESWYDFVDLVQARSGVPTEVRILRGDTDLVRSVTPEPVEEADPVTGARRTVGRVGVGVHTPRETASFSEAVAQGWRATVSSTVFVLEILGGLVTGQVSPRSMGSIVTIGQVSGQAAAAGIAPFLDFMALFSVNLAILNLLPIPILDGGHLVFLAIEAVRGRAVSAEQRLKWSNVGFLVVMVIMVWALSNDFLRLFGL